MGKLHITFNNLSFSYNTIGNKLFENINISMTNGWTGVIGENGIGKSTLLKLCTGLLQPVKGFVESPDTPIYCEQRTDNPPDKWEDFISSNNSLGHKLLGKLGIKQDWLNRWKTLSHGERKRAQIAVALWQEPNILAIDEPTNHLDKSAREMLADSLKLFKGIGLLVSHDKELLDSLCYQCLFIDPPNCIIRPGGVSQGLEQEKMENEYNLKKYKSAKKEYKKILRKVSRRREIDDKQKKKSSKRGIDRKDHDAKTKKDVGRLTGKDAIGGKLLNQINGRLQHAESKLENIEFKKDFRLGIWMNTLISRRDTLFNLESGQIKLGDKASLNYPDLIMRPSDRIGVSGANGSGKTSLIERIVDSINISKDNLVYIPQEIPLSSSKSLLQTIKKMPNQKKGHIMTIVSCLGTRPERLIDSVEPSPGETRKMLLAIGIANQPHLIIMDEPTNHLDINAIGCLENALKDCPCGLLLVSHDKRFLNSLTEIEWSCERNEQDSDSYILKIL